MNLTTKDRENIIDSIDTYNGLLDKLITTLPIDSNARGEILQKRDGMVDTRVKININEKSIHQIALEKLMGLINVDKDGSYFICEEATPIIDRCQAILDDKIDNFDNIA